MVRVAKKAYHSGRGWQPRTNPSDPKAQKVGVRMSWLYFSCGAQSRRWLWALAALSLLIAPLSSADDNAPNLPPRITANSNLAASGQLQGGVLKLNLELREGTWYPDADHGPSVVVNAFAEEGKPPQVPGPLIRVAQGTEILARVRNHLPVKATVFGLFERPGDWGSGFEVQPDSVTEVRFRAGNPGTYFYWARTTSAPFSEPAAVDTLLNGALVIDPPGVRPDDRILVLGLWYVEINPSLFYEVAVINGKSWPFTERFTFDQGETVAWRVLNPTFSDHAMHLHGFYFRVDSKGNGARDELYPVSGQRQVVTERIDLGETMTMTWTPHTAGNWLFHCHMLAHMSPEARLAMHGKKAPEHPHTEHDPTAGMGGLVIGVSVRPKAPAVVEARSARKLRLLVRERTAAWPDPPGVGFQIQEGDKKPSPSEVPFPGAPLVLTRGEPVEITVINQLREPTTVHWHGIELESYYDGVAYWTGTSSRPTPPIPPGGSFIARMTPPHAGTFIYHTHWHDEMQLFGGLYGPLLVLEPGQKYDPETDKTFVIGVAREGRILVNGSMQPDAIRLRAGTLYRLRLINITANGADIVVMLRDGHLPVRWRAVAKDGKDLPPAQMILREARQHVAVGETYDFEFQPDKPGIFALEVYAPFLRRWVIYPLEAVAAPPATSNP